MIDKTELFPTPQVDFMPVYQGIFLPVFPDEEKGDFLTVENKSDRYISFFEWLSNDSVKINYVGGGFFYVVSEVGIRKVLKHFLNENSMTRGRFSSLMEKENDSGSIFFITGEINFQDELLVIGHHHFNDETGFTLVHSEEGQNFAMYQKYIEHMGEAVTEKYRFWTEEMNPEFLSPMTVKRMEKLGFAEPGMDTEEDVYNCFFKTMDFDIMTDIFKITVKTATGISIDNIEFVVTTRKENKDD